MPHTVYVLTNPAMPGLVKIGFSAQEETKTRISQLYSTGVPVPFEIQHVAMIENAEAVEKALHTAFAPQRINSKREFFKIDPGQAIAILRVMEISDETKQISEESDVVDQESKEAGEQLRRRRPNMNFEEMGIPIGSTLYYTQGNQTVTVVDSRRVKFRDEEMSLTAATRIISQVDYDQPAALYWTYKGRLLREIYEERYEIPD